jgi:putative zinc finger protein
MSLDPVVGCTERLGVNTLNAWHDGVLDPAQAQHFTRHLRGCAACQARLGEYGELAVALRSIQTPNPMYGYGHNPRLRAQAQAGHRDRASHRARLRLVSGLGTVAAVLLVALAFAQIFAAMGRRAGTGPIARATTVPAATATPVPTIGPGQFTPIISLQDAWGTHAAVAQVNAVLDATHDFLPESVTPDGRQLLGTLYTIGTPAHGETVQAGLLDVTTRHFTPVGKTFTRFLATGDGGGSCTDSDERYVICYDETDSSANSPTVVYWSYDRVSKQARVITDTAHYAIDGGVFVSHGTLVFSAGKQAYEIDLATNAIAPLSLSSQGPVVAGFSWPYLVYFDQPGYFNRSAPAQLPNVRAHDLATGQDVALPQVSALYAANKNVFGNNISLLRPVITGDTLFMTVTTGRLATTNFPPNNVTDAVMTLFELDHIFDASAQPRPVARYHLNYNASIPSGANARLVGFGIMAWDRAEDRWVKFSSLPDGQGPGGYLNGNILVTFDNVNSRSSQEVIIYDTAQLPTTGG